MDCKYINKAVVVVWYVPGTDEVVVGYVTGPVSETDELFDAKITKINLKKKKSSKHST